jgi:hypothetical protein
MELSTSVVLSVLTFENTLLLTCGLFVMWLAGELGDRDYE